jgi:hypothetical protein
VDADGGQRLADFVKLEGFDNGDNELHVQAFISFEYRSAQRPRNTGIFLSKWHKKITGKTEKRLPRTTFVR